MSETNPYQAPVSHVADVAHAQDDGGFIPNGHAVDAGHGWQWIAEGFGLFKRQPGMWIGIIIVIGIIFIVLALIPFLGSLATVLLSPVFGAGLIIGCKALDQGDDLEFAHLFAGFKRNTGSLIVIALIYLAAVFVSLIVPMIVAGSVFFRMFGGTGGDPAVVLGQSAGIMAIAGLLWLAFLIPVVMAYWFAPALVALNDMTPVAAMKASFFGCLKNIIPFLLYGVIAIVLAIIAAIPLGLGFLIFGPVIVASLYTAYRDIFYER